MCIVKHSDRELSGLQIIAVASSRLNKWNSSNAMNQRNVECSVSRNEHAHVASTDNRELKNDAPCKY